MAPTRLPSTIRIGAFTYKVDVKPTKQKWLANRAELAREGAVAFCDVKQHLLMVDPEVAEMQRKESVVHELFHACFAAGGQPDLDDAEENEERFVQVTSHMWLMFMRDNPKWVAWLMED